MEVQQHLQLKKFANLLYRWKAFIYFCLLAAIAAGTAYYIITPKTYRSTALLIYDKQKVNPSKMSQEMTTRTSGQEIISSLSQQVTSRTFLEEVIKAQNLYVSLRNKMPMEDVIEAMRKHIKVTPTKGDLFEVSYEGDDPRQVLKVTNALAGKFIEENLKLREEQASETSAYLHKERERTKKSLDEKESILRDYKLKYYNEMPQQREANIQMINTLQLQIQGKQTSIQELERTKVLIQEQLVLSSRGLSSQAEEDKAATAQAPTGSVGDEPEVRLEKLRGYLDSLLLKYTEQHPEVQRVRRMIASMEAELTSQKDKRPAGGGSPTADRPKPKTNKQYGKYGNMQVDLELQMKDIDRSIFNLRADQENLRKQLDKYQTWFAAAPVREAEWSALTRDYEELKHHYDSLVTQSLQAESVSQLEKQQKGSQFRVVDPARLPESPYWPNIRRILAMALAGGLGFAFCVILVANFFDFSFREVHELENYLQLPVSCTIPYIETTSERRWRRAKIFLWCVTILTSLAGLGAAFWYLISRGLVIL